MKKIFDEYMKEQKRTEMTLIHLAIDYCLMLKHMEPDLTADQIYDRFIKAWTRDEKEKI